MKRIEDIVKETIKKTIKEYKTSFVPIEIEVEGLLVYRKPIPSDDVTIEVLIERVLEKLNLGVDFKVEKNKVTIIYKQ